MYYFRIPIYITAVFPKGSKSYFINSYINKFPRLCPTGIIRQVTNTSPEIEGAIYRFVFNSVALEGNHAIAVKTSSSYCLLWDTGLVISDKRF